MLWYSPPTRRETSLVLFSLAVFVLFYNLEYSFTRDASRAGAAHDQDRGREPEQEWDAVIYGDWTWEENEVAHNAEKRPAVAETRIVSFRPQVFGTVGVNDGIREWGAEVPATKVLKHVPGYTILDNVYVLNGTLFVVTGDEVIPPLGEIASSGKDLDAGPRAEEWQVIDGARASEILGPFGGVVHGVTWLAMDPHPSNYTLFALWRTYSALSASLSPDAPTLPPPRRVFFPRVPTFAGERPDLNGPIVTRQRSPSGFHPFLAKAAFPTLGLMYQEDWTDYALLHVPFLLTRIVIADERAARRSQTHAEPPFASALALRTGKGWWEPIRRNVARFVGVPEEAPRRTWLGRTETVVTYLSCQDAVGPKLRGSDHEALVGALGMLGSERGFTVYVVPSDAGWVERMTAIAQSTVVIGVYGEHMADGVYVPPSSRATVMEVFPPGVFVRDVATAVEAVDVEYVAWRAGQQFKVDRLPEEAGPGEEGEGEIPLDVNAVMQAIRRIA